MASIVKRDLKYINRVVFFIFSVLPAFWLSRGIAIRESLVTIFIP